MRLARRGCLAILGALTLFVLGVAPVRSDAQTNPTAPAVPPHIDLSDPRVRERLRAAGIDPAELERLRAQHTEKSQGAPNAAPQFPPVTPASAATPAAPLPGAAAADSSAVAPEPEPGAEEYFGYEIFTMSPKTFEPLTFGPVPANYLVGPGDEIIVSVWGAQELSVRAEVNREGYLLIPDLGQVLVNGYTLDGLKEHLENRLSRIYSGIRSDGQRRTWVEVSLGKLRSIQVFVLGDVIQPGGYMLTATSTVLNALYYAGGPALTGSLRDVRVMRGSKTLRSVDLYEYIARGDRSNDIALENGDVVFVPPVGKRVTLKGEVQRAAIFELRDDDTLATLLELAGGMRSTAYLSRVQIERLVPFEERSPLSQEDRRVVDMNLEPGSGQDPASTRMLDGDVVQVFRVGDILKNTVTITGTAVQRPGTYEHVPGMRVSQLITNAGGLLGDAYAEGGHLLRTRPDKTRELVSFNLSLALQGDPEANLELMELDEVQVFSVWDIKDQEFVSIEGKVRKPGRYELLEGMTITDLIVRAGGLSESAYRVSAEVARIDPEAISTGRTAELLQVAMDENLGAPSPASDFLLQENDIVFIRETPHWTLQENVWITGEVRFPGMYSLTSKLERMTSLVERAGGLEETAYLRGATFMRKKDSTGRVAIDFEAALRKGNKSSKFDLVMVAGDSIHIPREPKTVKVAGQVGFPSSVLFEHGRSMHWYIDQAGGTLESADTGKIRVVMANGRIKRPGWFRSPEPDAGATIIVPAKPEEKDHETLKNFAQIVSILTGAATTIYLISQASN